MDTEIILVIAASGFVFCLLIFIFGFVLKYQHKTAAFLKERELTRSQFEQAILQSQVEVQEATFSMVSKELHDNIGQLLSTAKLLIAVTEMNMQEPPESLVTAKTTIGTAIIELRSLSKSLSKEWLERFDLLENLAAEVSRISATKTIKTHLEKPEKIYLNPEKQLLLFRTIQEAISNVIKHAAASSVVIRLVQDAKQVFIEVRDDGRGFDVNTLSGGLGLANIRHRVELLGGTVKWQSPGTGTIVEITLRTGNDSAER